MHVRFETPDISELRKDHMLVDMHFHSRYSHDSSTSVQAIINKAKQLGVYVALTDHNSINGVLAARKIAPGRIKPGVEITTKENKDILVYFYNVQDLENFFNEIVRPHLKKQSSIRMAKTTLKAATLLKELKKWRCVVALAHPFAIGNKRSYRLFTNGNGLMEKLDAIETVNQALPHKNNLAGIGLAVQYGKAFIGGTDGHILPMLGCAFTVSKASTWAEFLENVKKHRVFVVGEQQKLRHHVVNMSRILREKAKVIGNRKMRKERL